METSDFRDKPFLVKSRKGAWTIHYIALALGELVEEKKSHQIYTQCVLGLPHKRATVSIANGRYEYMCYGCSNEQRLSFEKQKELFQEWLDRNELVHGKWRQHLNPFDAAQEAPELTFWMDLEGKPLLYRGGIHFIYGKPGTFKSWFSQALMLDANVRIWDFENGLASTLHRLQSLGVPYERAGGYTSPASEKEVLERVEEYLYTRPEVLVIDSFSGFAEVMNVNGEANNEVMSVFKKVLFPLKQAGVTVIILDHLPKDASSPDYPIGAQAKRSQADVTILFKHTTEPNVVEVYVSKDRHGELSSRCEPGASPRKFGSLNFESIGDQVSLTLTPAYAAKFEGAELSASDATLLEHIYSYLESNPRSPKSAIETSIPGKTDRKRKALQKLVGGGYVMVEAIGTSLLHSVNKKLVLSWTSLGN